MKAEHGIIIVTGSNGRIGEAVMPRPAGCFTGVVGFDRKAPRPPPPGCVYIPVEITSDESVRDGLRTIREHHGAQVASAIHLAAYYEFFGKPSSKYDGITVQAPSVSCACCMSSTFRSSSSSSPARCWCIGQKSREYSSPRTRPSKATWAYAVSKVQTEQLIHAERGNIPAALLRVAGVYARFRSRPQADRSDRPDCLGGGHSATQHSCMSSRQFLPLPIPLQTVILAG